MKYIYIFIMIEDRRDQSKKILITVIGILLVA